MSCRQACVRQYHAYDSVADDLTRLLNRSSKMQSTDSNLGGSSIKNGSKQTNKSLLSAKELHHLKAKRRLQSHEISSQANTSGGQNQIDGPPEKRVQSANRKFNMDINMNMIKEEGNEGELTSQRHLRKRIEAIQMTRQQQQRVRKLQKAQVSAQMRHKRSHSRLNKAKKALQGGATTFNTDDEHEFARENMDADTLSGILRNSSIPSYKNNDKNQFPSKFRPPNITEGEFSSSFNPKKNTTMAAQMTQSGSHLRRFDTHVNVKRTGSLAKQKINNIMRLSSEQPDEYFQHQQQSSIQKTPAWNRSKADQQESDQLTTSNMKTQNFDRIDEVIEQQYQNNNKELTQQQQILYEQQLLDNAEIVASENLSQMDMFDSLNAEEQRQIENLKGLRQRQPIDVTNLKDQLLQVPFSPSDTYNLEWDSRTSSPLKDEQVQQPQFVQGRWLMPNDNQRIRNSSSEVRIECAREKRLSSGFQKRIMSGKNRDLFNHTADDNSTEDNNISHQSKMNRSQGNKLHGYIIQKPPQTSFDFKDLLRRPVSAQQSQVNQAMLNFQKMQKQKDLEQLNEKLMQEKKEAQIKELKLDQFSWDMNLATIGLFPNKEDKSNTSEGIAVKELGKGGKGKKKSKGKGKKEKEEKSMETDQEKRLRILEEIDKQKREQENNNLWPKPMSKIFMMSPRSMSANRLQPRERRNIISKTLKRSKLNQKMIEKQRQFNEQMTNKLNQLQDQSYSAHDSKHKKSKKNLNSDLLDDRIIEKSDSQSSATGSERSKAKASLLSSNQQLSQKSKSNPKTASKNQLKLLKKKSVVRPSKLNADLPMMSKNTMGPQLGKSKFSSSMKKLPVKARSMMKYRQPSFMDSEDETRIALQQINARTAQLRREATIKKHRAIEAIQKGGTWTNKKYPDQKRCPEHRTFGCKCQQVRFHRTENSQLDKGLKRIESRRETFNRISARSKLMNFKRTWEQQPASKNSMFKPDPSIYVREPPKPDWKMIEENYDGELGWQIIRQRRIKLYDVQDIQKELEELTEDEDEIKQLDSDDNDIWNIKKQIKVSLKKNFTPPDTLLDFYKIGKILGKGAYGKVNIALQKLTKKICAVKSINMNKEMTANAVKKITTEKEILTDLRHPSIVKLYETISFEMLRPKDKVEGYELIFMEICTGGNMLTYLRKRRRLDEKIAKLLMWQLINALGYMHHKHVVHRDIKLENILLSNLGLLKICDFGVSVVMTEKMRTVNEKTQKINGITDCCGTPAYMAPEVIMVGETRKDNDIVQRTGVGKKKKPVGYGKECDIWSAGVFLYALVYGQLPFRGITIREIKEKILAGKLILKDSTSEGVRDLIRGMLTNDPDDRLTVDQILQHEWFNDRPEQSEVTIFNESERAIMIKEYFLSEDVEKWMNFINFQDEDEVLQFQNWTNTNLNTTQSDLSYDPNVTEGSEILCPNASSRDQDTIAQANDKEFPSAEEDKEDKMEYSRQAYHADLQYEREHNLDCDKGVYRPDANIQDQAKRTGYKSDQTMKWSELLIQIKEKRVQRMKTEKQLKIIASQTSLMGQDDASKKPDDLEHIDPDKDWVIEQMREEKNPYSAPFVIRGDLIFLVTRFGYKEEDILDSIINNKPTHQAVTYYLLEKDHEQIS